MKKNSTITIFLGDDIKRAHEALRHAVENEKKKDPNILVSRFDDISFDATRACEALVGQSIFGGSNIVVMDGILDHPTGEEFYLSSKEFEKSANSVFICEQAPSKEVLALFKKIGTIEEFPLAKIAEKKNNFAIADAVAMRDKRSAWVLFTQLEREGAKMEEVHGVIFWALKSLYLCATQTKEEAIRAGVKEYTYRTYSPRTKNFLTRELEEKLGELKDMYHVAHRGDAGLGLFLEQFLLKL